jgi:hypothetical protein
MMRSGFWPGRERLLILSLVLLFVLPLVSSLYVICFPSQVEVGIVLVDDCDVFFAEVAQEGLGRYERFFDTTILETRVDSAGVRKNGSSYLTIDLNNRAHDLQLRSTHGVDVILMMTNHSVRNWINNPFVCSGEADTVTESCVASVFGHEGDTEFNRTYIRHIALHEVGHLLGYRHCPDMDCAMHRSKYGTEFCTGHGFELPFRAALWSLGSGLSFGLAAFVINCFLVLFFMPFLILYVLLIRWSFARFLKKGSEMSTLCRGIALTLSLFVLMISNTILFGLLVNVLIVPLVVGFFYLRTYLKNTAPSD